jgi:hypothetical protein
MMGQNRVLMRSFPCSLWVVHLVFDEHSLWLSLFPPISRTHTKLRSVCRTKSILRASVCWVTSTANRWHISEKYTR